MQFGIAANIIQKNKKEKRKIEHCDNNQKKMWTILKSILVSKLGCKEKDVEGSRVWWHTSYRFKFNIFKIEQILCQHYWKK